jgi:hypothetical protein
MNLLFMTLNNRLELLLQFLAMGKLLIYERLHLASVSNTACFGFALILLPDFVVLAGDTKPNPLEALRYPLRTLKGFLLPAFFLLLL